MECAKNVLFWSHLSLIPRLVMSATKSHDLIRFLPVMVLIAMGQKVTVVISGCKIIAEFI